MFPPKVEPDLSSLFISDSPAMEKMKRILFVTKNLHLGGGAEKQIVEIANGLHAKGFAVAILVFETKSEKNIRTKDLNPEIEIIHAGSRRLWPFLLRAVREIMRVASVWKPDALYSRIWNTKPAAAIAGKLLGIKVVLGEAVSPQNSLPDDLPLRWRIWPKYFAFFYRKTIYGLADVVVGVSEGVARETKEFFRLKNKVKAIQNGLDAEKIREKSRMSDDVPHEYFRIGCPVLVSTGRLARQKGFKYLLEAFAIASEFVDIRLIIIGGGKMKDKLRLKAKSLGINDKVDMIGETEPYCYMRCGDIFVLSSLYEGFPNVLLEAASLGMPIVSTECPHGPGEIIENGKSGLLVPVADPEKLASAILTLLRDEKLRLSVGNEAEKKARYFTRERMASGYEEVFLNL